MKRRGAAGHRIAVEEARDPLHSRHVSIDGKLVARVVPAAGGWTFVLLGDAGAWLPTRETWEKRSRAEGAALTAVRRLVAVLLERHDAATMQWLTQGMPVDNIMA